MTSAGKWTWVHGASWLIENGEIYPVNGFHETWIKENSDMVPGCRNVCDVVLLKRWISVGIYSKGYVELLIPGTGESECLERARVFLEKSIGKWEQALFITIGKEGYVKISPDDITNAKLFKSLFLSIKA